jgi:carbonic anhydrase/acetyltransferase-like protein (isoleucine patch superfamily)
VFSHRSVRFFPLGCPIFYVSGVAIYALGSLVPKIHQTAFVHPDATVIGDVTIGAGSSIWPQAVLRGDGGYIVVGDRTSIQDGSVIHTTELTPTTVGNDCVVGHMVHLEGCTIEDECLLGVGSIILHRVVVRTGAVVAANCVLLNDMEVPSGALAVGTPAVIKEGKARVAEVRIGAKHYAERTQQYLSELRRID